MTLNKLLLVIAPVGLMIAMCLGLTGSETWLARFGNSVETQQTLGRIGIALPYLSAAAVGVTFLFAARGAMAIKSAGFGVLVGAVGVIALAGMREVTRLSDFAASKITLGNTNYIC